MTYAQFELQKIDVITKKEKEFIENAGVSFRQIFIQLHEFELKILLSDLVNMTSDWEFDLESNIRPLIQKLTSYLKIDLIFKN